MAEATGIEESLLKPERRIVKFGQEFHPFDQLEGNVERKGDVEIGDAVIVNRVALNLGEIKIPIDIKMQSFSPGASEVITPFDPGLKLDRQFDSRVPFCLKIDANSSLLNKHGFNEKTNLPAWEGPGQQFSEEMLELLKRLKVQVQANGSFYEGKAGEEQPLEYGALWFDFYHKEARGEQKDTASKKGRFMLGFPNDPEKLKQIQLQFVSVPEEPQDTVSKNPQVSS